MAIIRSDINASVAALKTALESLGLFASVTLDSDSTPTTVTCKDADNNVLLTYSLTGSGSGTTSLWRVYKDASTNVSTSQGGTTAGNRPKKFYKVGSNGAVIETYDGYLYTIGKTNTEAIGVAMQDSATTALVACWGDDASMTTKLTICASSNPMAGNHVLFVPIPMHGSYNTATYLPKSFFLPMVQANMRNIVQEVSGDAGVYLTNGYLAMIDDAGGAA